MQAVELFPSGGDFTWFDGFTLAGDLRLAMPNGEIGTLTIEAGNGQLTCKECLVMVDRGSLSAQLSVMKKRASSRTENRALSPASVARANLGLCWTSRRKPVALVRLP